MLHRIQMKGTAGKKTNNSKERRSETSSQRKREGKRLSYRQSDRIDSEHHVQDRDTEDEFDMNKFEERCWRGRRQQVL